jgi:hypothetical protein
MNSMHSPPEQASDWSAPWWDDHGSFPASLEGSNLPAPDQLNEWLPPGTTSGGGKRLRFVPASRVPAVDYERHIFETGEVSTREDSWHDLFNALVWCALPCLKSAMNALHYAHIKEAHDGRRGAQRDALTLLDESGAIVVSSNRPLLAALAGRDWRQAFREQAGAWRHDVRTVICGHGLLEKLRAPYKSITAHVLLLHQDAAAAALWSDDFLSGLDMAVGQRLLGGLCPAPADLSPLPLMGIPGWWPEGDQDESFYDDAAVFRSAPRAFRPAPIHIL